MEEKKRKRNERVQRGHNNDPADGSVDSSTNSTNVARAPSTNVSYQSQRGRGGRGGGGRGGRGGGRGRGGKRVTGEGGYKPVARPAYKSPYKGLEMVISGGQTGADRGGLMAAKDLGIATGGTAPSNFLTEKGPDISLKREFNLKEGMCDYADRTKMVSEGLPETLTNALVEQNVDDSDGTIAIRLQPGNGTDKTIGWCHWAQWTYGKDRAQSKDDGWRPVLVITDISEEKAEENVAAIQDFVIRNKIRVLNVAGHRETTAGIENFTEKVHVLLLKAFAAVLNAEIN